nr:hypothetical protein [uncultured Psychrobacter sp.]
MSKRLISMAMILASSLAVLAGCDNSASTTDAQSAQVASTTKQNTSDDQAVATGNTAAAGAMDWSLMASDVTPIDRADFDYPFESDSQNVKDYADYFDVDTATAQYNLTVGMASNEALSKALDQLSNNYTSHELTDGEDIKLIIHTTPDIQADRYDYVFEGDYAKGLTLPIVIVPDGKKAEVDVHGEAGE